MQLTVCKRFDRAVHSYLMHLKVEADDIDPAVFVVKNSPITDLPSSSSIPEEASSEIPLPLPGPLEEESSSSGSEEPEPGPSEESSSSEEAVDCEPISIRILVSVASLTDLAVYPLYSPGLNQLYRTDTVSIMSRSHSHMNKILEELLSDLQINARIQGLVDISPDVVVVRDVAVGSNQDQIYAFR
jgi:hypothetical protein